MVATNNEAFAEWAWNAGSDDSATPWLLHPHDIWVANPHYTGPVVPHPESDSGMYEEAPSELDLWKADMERRIRRLEDKVLD